MELSGAEEKKLIENASIQFMREIFKSSNCAKSLIDKTLTKIGSLDKKDENYIEQFNEINVDAWDNMRLVSGKIAEYAVIMASALVGKINEDISDLNDSTPSDIVYGADKIAEALDAIAYNINQEK